MGLCLMNMLGPSSSVRVAHIACYWKFFLLHSVGTCFARQIILILRILCYNGSLVTWTVVKVKVTLRPAVSQSVSLGVEPHLGLMTRCLIAGRPHWQEDGSVFWICCWPLPEQSFSGPSPLGLSTIFYCLRSESSPPHRELPFSSSQLSSL
jgi:hypothetical protein